MNINPSDPKKYIQDQLDSLSWEETMRLAKFLEEEELHLCTVEDRFIRLTRDNNDANINTVDADKRADAYRDSLDEIWAVLRRIYG